MSQSPLAQANLFDDADEDHGPSLRQAWARQAPPRRRRLTCAFDPEGAAQILDEHDDYRVLRRLKPRTVDTAYQLGPGESVALVVDVETTGLDHRRDEVIELGMVAFMHDAKGRIGPVIGVLSMLHEPKGEISAEITRLTGITAEMVAGPAIDMGAVRGHGVPGRLDGARHRHRRPGHQVGPSATPIRDCGGHGSRRQREPARAPSHLARRLRVQVSLTDGSAVTARVRDISRSGAALTSGVLPESGRIVTLGSTRGRVVRLHDGGFAV